MTIEEAQQEILRLDEALKTITAERDSLSNDNESLKIQLEDSRTLNQKMFLELRQQNNTDDGDQDEDEPDVPTCEDFAKTLHI